ncbi:hypothetical protein BT96DRAFT_1004450 [Gymnopus androsaceus JB14]|uniref:Uncharacterized protein n=1 Tax=Gymnopus androsaceus JB14 TaxID=1447944 RepID=A0A6A4GS70_9AGAR|nr:hypothetical protein BT96DRAFT_1004450 [Gymnopus androsaceus JB14]
MKSKKMGVIHESIHAHDYFEAWEAQVGADNQEAQQQAEERDRIAEQLRLQVEREAAKKKVEEEEKRFKPLAMEENAMVLTHQQPHPLPFALEKMQKYEFVDLWYFGLEGIGDKPDVALVALQPLSTLTHSSKAIPDK